MRAKHIARKVYPLFQNIFSWAFAVIFAEKAAQIALAHAYAFGYFAVFKRRVLNVLGNIIKRRSQNARYMSLARKPVEYAVEYSEHFKPAAARDIKLFEPFKVGKIIPVITERNYNKFVGKGRRAGEINQRKIAARVVVKRIGCALRQYHRRCRGKAGRKGFAC